MSKVNTYSIKGIHLAPTTLPKDFDAKENLNLLAQAIRVYQEEAHIGLAKAKTRAEVNRTKKKWYKQKGTGGARHGPKSAPIFVGGGIAHGPKLTRRELTMPRKMAQKAVDQALTAKLKNKEIVILSGLEKVKKTAEIKVFLKKFSKSEKTAAKHFTFVLSDENLPVKKFLRNLTGVEIVSYKSLNALEVFRGGVLFFDSIVFGKAKK